MTRRSLFTRQFWREYRRDVFRFAKDPRARKDVLLRTASLLYFAAVLLWYGSAVVRTHDTATYVLLSGLLLLAAVALAGRKIALMLEERRSLAQDLAATPAEVAQGLQDLAYGALAVAERAVSELWLSRHTIPEGFEPAARRIQIEALRKTGTWNTMPAAARHWMMRPDGGWPPATVADVLAGAEILHSLLWVLYLTPELRPVEGLSAPISLKETAAALRKPVRGVRPTWDLRVERNKAQTYFQRCFAEGVYRGTVSVQDEEQRAAMNEWAVGFQDGSVADAWAGNDPIHASDVDTLAMVHRSSACRILTLEGATALMEGLDHWPAMTRLVYRPLLDEEDGGNQEDSGNQDDNGNQGYGESGHDAENGEDSGGAPPAHSSS